MGEGTYHLPTRLKGGHWQPESQLYANVVLES